MDRDIRDLEQKVEELSEEVEELSEDLHNLANKVDDIDKNGYRLFSSLRRKTAWEVWILLILVIILFFIK